jgi:nucleoside-diphosphate-sugar epimerase
MAGPVRKRQFPIIGDGGGVWSHIHIEDAAAATAIAVERGAPGVYYIVDDEPATVRDWLPTLASALDAKPPRRIPRWLGRLVAGEMATIMMTDVHGASNAKLQVADRAQAVVRAREAGLGTTRRSPADGPG